MADDHDRESKTEQPTERRLEKAREQGSVVRAHGLASGAVLVSGAIALSFAGGRLVELLELSLQRSFTLEPDSMREPARLLGAVGRVMAPAIEIVIPFLILTAVVGFVSDILVGGWIFSAPALSLDLSRISPGRGLARLLSHDALVEIAKALVKFVVVGAIAFWLLRKWDGAFFHLAAETWPGALDHAALLWSRVFLILAACLAGTAALEVPYQLWAHRDRLRMTRQELKDEMRELDGSPQTRRRMRALRRRLAQMRMATEVPKADVVVTNPNHYAAALKYREGEMRAPRLVAKGADLIALRIREIAAEYAIPQIEAPPLARAICRFVEIDEEIPAGLYTAVAEVLAYVYRLRAARDAGRTHPPVPRDGRFDPPSEFAS
jgi:flagellar biosynthetic protein FlhB